MRKITKRDVNAATKPTIFDFGNRVLYDLCRNHPRHTRPDQVIAKLLLIGRSYSAALERRRRVPDADNGNDFYQSTVAPMMLAADVDSWFKTLRGDKCPGSVASVIIHKRLQDLFYEMTNLEKRSLASKYLHFHFPHVFFLYDSRAAWAIRRIVPRMKRRSKATAINAKVDPVYDHFVRNCVWLRDHVHDKHKVWLTPRQLDRLLLNITDNERISNSGKAMTKRRNRFIGKASDFIIIRKSDGGKLKNADQSRESTDIKSLLKNARRQARNAGMKKSDIEAAIHKVRQGS